MNKYTVLDKSFSRFEDVVQWAWDWYKIELDPFGANFDSEESKQAACAELAQIILLEYEGGYHS